jgi:ketosteroid isomerase-like protein
MEGSQTNPRKTLKTLALLLLLALPLSAQEEDKQALRDLKAVYEKAIATKDLELIKPHLASDFSAVMITADEVKDYDGIKAYWKKVEEFIGEDGTYTVSIEPDDTIFQGDIAIAKGIAKEHVVRKGKTIDLVTKWTAIARKEEGKWKLVRIHATIDPVNNPIISVLNKGKLWITGGVAGIAGFLIGLLWRRKALPA